MASVTPSPPPRYSLREMLIGIVAVALALTLARHSLVLLIWMSYTGLLGGLIAGLINPSRRGVLFGIVCAAVVVYLPAAAILVGKYVFPRVMPIIFLAPVVGGIWGGCWSRSSRRLSTGSVRQRLHTVVFGSLVTLLLLATGVISAKLNEAQRQVHRAQQYGKLSQLRLGFANFEARTGLVPRKFVLAPDGQPLLGCVAAILPELEEDSTFQALDLTQAWDAAANATARQRGDSLWRWLTDGGQRLPCPLASDRSFWDPKTGQPRGQLADFPQAILLVMLPRSDIHPLQPYEVSEAQVRAGLEAGHEVLFVNCRGDCGQATVENGQVSFAIPDRSSP